MVGEDLQDNVLREFLHREDVDEGRDQTLVKNYCIAKALIINI